MKLNELYMDENIKLDQASEEVIELATSYVENYIDYAENLPFDLQHNVSRLREIDVHCREFLLEIENLYSSFTKEKDLNLKKRGILLQIQRLLARCQELGDEKISIVQQINESIENKRKQVDHSCYRLKSAYRPDIKIDFGQKKDGLRGDNKGIKRTRRHRVTQHYGEKHEKVLRMESSPGEYKSSSYNGLPWKQSLHSSIDCGNQLTDSSSNIGEDFGFAKKSERFDKKESSTPPPSSSLTSSSHSSASYVASKSVTASTKTSTTSTKTSSSSAATSVPPSNGSNRSSVKGKKKKKKVNRHHSERGSVRSPSPQPELPIDPDEPTYCLCDQVSFGQMIGCDNKKCPIEWFHFSCVGLSHKPKGKWYCPDCLRDIKDRRKDNKRDR